MQVKRHGKNERSQYIISSNQNCMNNSEITVYLYQILVKFVEKKKNVNFNL